jgi:uncharacterized membrane protein YhaH (DUF805 family)
MDFETLFVDPRGRTSRGRFLPALFTLLAAAAFYALLVKSRTGLFCLLVLLLPGAILHARRLHDMGRSATLLLIPIALSLAAFAIRLHYLSFGTQVDALLPPLALAVCAGFAAWGCIGQGQAAANRFGEPAAA